MSHWLQQLRELNPAQVLVEVQEDGINIVFFDDVNLNVMGDLSLIRLEKGYKLRQLSTRTEPNVTLKYRVEIPHNIKPLKVSVILRDMLLSHKLQVHLKY